MPDDLTTLQSSLVDRATALGSYVHSLKADSARSDDGFRHALDVCEAYTSEFVDQVEADWRSASDRDERRDMLQGNLESFLLRERWIDQRFARGAQRDVPRALKTIARREFRNHNLDDHEPVLTVGPPDSFETHQTSLANFLFHGHIYAPSAEVQERFLGGPHVSIFSIPYIEGTRVPWYPIVLGHEIAHSRLDRAGGSRQLQKIVDEWVLIRNVEFGTMLEETVSQSRDPLQARGDASEQLLNWVTELVCDLNAVRLFGPAGLSAIAEFLAILESQHDKGTLDMETHPPLWVRLRVLSVYLDRLGWSGDALPAHASVWHAEQGSSQETLGERARWAATLVTTPARVEQLIAFVRRWNISEEEYQAGVNVERIAHVERELLDGVPGATYAPTSRGRWTEVSIADVVNAAWTARRVLAEGADAEAGVLLASQLDPHDKRVKLDSLASKAIDTLELSRLWGRTKGIIPPDAVDAGTALPGDASHRVSPAGGDPTGEEHDAPPHGGVLSRRCFARLLSHDRKLPRNKRMVVTPLFEDSVQDAAIDLRLGPDFIVFRHSATKAFDPLADDGQDPRMMQERVHKGWGERFILHPQELVLASTLEYIVLPDDVAAQVLTRSSYGRLGLLTATAVQVQPGSRGCITLELVNQGETPIELAPGARVAQLMLWSLAEPCLVRRGRYWFPVGPEFSKVGADPDAPALRGLAEAARQPAVGRETPVRARLEGELPEADDFHRRARALGAVDAPSPFPGVTIEPRTLATAIVRWLQGHRYGVRIDAPDRDVVLRPDRTLPEGTALFTFANGAEERVEVPPDDATVIRLSLRRLLRSDRTAG